MKNIAFSKIGKSIKFKGTSYSASGGDNEPSACLRLLANNNPDVTFYLVGRSDFRKLTSAEKVNLFPYNNVIDCYSEKIISVHTHLNNFLKGIKIDAHIAMVGQVGTVTIPGKIQQVKDRSLIASVIDMTEGYSSPITCWMNDNQDIPIIEIINDPRYDFAQSRDIIVNPNVSLSQYNYTYDKSSIKSYEDQDRQDFKIQVTYSEMEKIFLYDRTVSDIKIENRKVPFLIVLNEGKPSRYNLLKDWVLDKISDVEIYGVWDEKYTKEDDRFKGSIHIEDLQKKLSNVRASFCIPIAPGWVTSKYIELIAAGVVPFLHPSYDTQNNTGLDEFFRPKNTTELFNRIQKLQNDDVYLKVINSLRRKYITTEYLDGSKLNNIIMKNVYQDYVKPDLSLFSKSINDEPSLDEFF